MKFKIAVSLLTLISFFGCEEKEKVIEIVDEVPTDIFSIPVCSTLSTSVMSLFAESRNNQTQYPYMFTDTVQSRIVMAKEGEVYVTFITEGSSIPSTLGYYTYTGNAPGASSDIKKTIIFPNVSNALFNQGDSRLLGKFPAGTVIGFFLIVGGYSNSTVNYSKPTFYTDARWNGGQQRQHVLFKENKCNDIVVGFEDKSVVTDSDSDYNDIVFIVSDNKNQQASSSFDIQKLVKL